MTQDIVIAGFKRTPFHPANKGQLAKLRPDDMVSFAVTALVESLNIDPTLIEDLILGCAFPEGEQGLNLGRLVVLNTGLPLSIGGCTVNRFCGSSMQSIHNAAGMIAAGAGDAFICAGVESMSRIPMGGFNFMPNPQLFAECPGAYMSMGDTAENLATRYKISREAQDQFALTSHQKAAAAQSNGAFDAEIAPVTVKGVTVDKDACIRADTTLEALGDLKPAFDEMGSVTAGSSSPLTDGAVATFVCSEAFATRHNLDVLAYLRSFAVAGVEPDIMGIGPVEATKKVLKRANLKTDDLDIIELNEAFASQALACIQELGLQAEKINLDGGAIALGHPLGATGARIVGKVAALLVREQKKYGLATQCIGGGQGIATLLERCS